MTELKSRIHDESNGLDSVSYTHLDADAAAALTKLLANPSMAELIKNLAKNL